MRETSDQFTRWLMGQLDNPETRGQMTWTELYGRLMNVELGPSARVYAIEENERFTSWIEAGFTRAEALRLLLNDRAAGISAAAAQQAHEREREEDGK